MLNGWPSVSSFSDTEWGYKIVLIFTLPGIAVYCNLCTVYCPCSSEGTGTDALNKRFGVDFWCDPLHWSCTEPSLEEQMWQGKKSSAGVSCAVESELPGKHSLLEQGTQCPWKAREQGFLGLKPTWVKLVPCKNRGTLLVMHLEWDEAWGGRQASHFTKLLLFCLYRLGSSCPKWILLRPTITSMPGAR